MENFTKSFTIVIEKIYTVLSYTTNKTLRNSGSSKHMLNNYILYESVIRYESKLRLHEFKQS